MNKTIGVIAIALLVILSASPCWADSETRDHICFQALDADEDGKVTYEEFADHYGTDKERFNRADANKDGHLTHDEYHAVLGHGARS